MMPNTNSVSPEAGEILEDLIGGPLEVGEYKADCPAHESVSGQSLSVTITEDKVLINCFAGCQTGDVLDALGLKYPDLFFFSPTRSHGGQKNKEPKLADFSRATAVYTYTTAAGEPVSRTVRFPERNSKKVVAQATYRDNTWWWGKPEGFKPVPYNLPGVYRALLNGEPIYIFEGESDVHAAAEWGLTADFSVVDPHRMMRTYDPTEGSTQPLLHAWRVRVNINAIRCDRYNKPRRRGQVL